MHVRMLRDNLCTVPLIILTDSFFTVAATDKCLMERITLLLLMVVPHTSTIPLEDFYPFGEAVGDGYLTGINQREGVYYIESVFFGHTNQRVGVSITYSFQHKYICSVYLYFA